MDLTTGASSNSSKNPPFDPSSLPPEPKLFSTNTATLNAALDEVIANLVDEEAFNFIVGCGRQLRYGELEALGLLEDNESEEFQVVDAPGVDIFGQPLTKKPNFECECPKCKRTLAAARFAPHLEKCMGMGRNSSRIASLKNRRLAAASSSSAAAAASAARDANTFPTASSNSSDCSNDSSPIKNSGEALSEDDHFEEDEDDEEWTIEKKKKTKKSSEKVAPKKKGALSRVKKSELRRNKRGVSPSVSVTSSPASMDAANYDELTNDSFTSYM